jgi:DNA-binding NarL/FixJ family response regulator
VPGLPVAVTSPAADIEVVGETGDGRDTIDAATALSPDIVVMDIRMWTPWRLKSGSSEFSNDRIAGRSPRQ